MNLNHLTLIAIITNTFLFGYWLAQPLTKFNRSLLILLFIVVFINTIILGLKLYVN